MAARNRSNPLALAVLMCLYERSMHPYEVATTLRQRHKDDSIRLNYGSLYAVVAALERRGLIAEEGTARAGRLPERTVYRITDAGRVEAHDWLAELISTPGKEYPAFEAGLSFLPALPPEEALALLEERAVSLELALAQARATTELVEARGLPRLLWVEGEYAIALRDAELAFVRRLIADIAGAALGGIEWWRSLHSEDGPSGPPPFVEQWPEIAYVAGTNWAVSE
jgi:DNA-binding PadR family transcriptional regulator